MGLWAPQARRIGSFGSEQGVRRQTAGTEALDQLDQDHLSEAGLGESNPSGYSLLPADLGLLSPLLHGLRIGDPNHS